MSKLISESENRIIFSKSGKIELNFVNDKNWSMPVKISLYNSKTPIEELGEKIDVLTSINWTVSDNICTYLDLLRGSDKCGIPRDFLDSSINIDDGNKGMISIVGNGICVTPLSNCPQRIEAIIRTKKTTQIFSKIMVSGILNPLLGGIILSGLLTSPDEIDSNVDHKVKVEVIGSKFHQ